MYFFLLEFFFSCRSNLSIWYKLVKCKIWKKKIPEESKVMIQSKKKSHFFHKQIYTSRQYKNSRLVQMILQQAVGEKERERKKKLEEWKCRQYKERGVQGCIKYEQFEFITFRALPAYCCCCFCCECNKSDSNLQQLWRKIYYFHYFFFGRWKKNFLLPPLHHIWQCNAYETFVDFLIFTVEWFVKTSVFFFICYF